MAFTQIGNFRVTQTESARTNAIPDTTLFTTALFNSIPQYEMDPLEMIGIPTIPMMDKTVRIPRGTSTTELEQIDINAGSLPPRNIDVLSQDLVDIELEGFERTLILSPHETNVSRQFKIQQFAQNLHAALNRAKWAALVRELANLYDSSDSNRGFMARIDVKTKRVVDSTSGNSANGQINTEGEDVGLNLAKLERAKLQLEKAHLLGGSRGDPIIITSPDAKHGFQNSKDSISRDYNNVGWNLMPGGASMAMVEGCRMISVPPFGGADDLIRSSNKGAGKTSGANNEWTYVLMPGDLVQGVPAPNASAQMQTGVEINFREYDKSTYFRAFLYIVVKVVRNTVVGVECAAPAGL